MVGSWSVIVLRLNLCGWRGKFYSEKANTVLYHTEPKAGKSEMLAMTPIEFLRRWTLLLPPPRRNLVHYYGALALRSPLRPLLVAKAEKEADQAALREKIDKVKKKAGSWAACLARVFEVYPLTCPRCGLEMKPVAVILNDKELVRLLTHLGLAGGIPGIPAGRAAVAV